MKKGFLLSYSIALLKGGNPFTSQLFRNTNVQGQVNKSIFEWSTGFSKNFSFLNVLSFDLNTLLQFFGFFKIIRYVELLKIGFCFCDNLIVLAKSLSDEIFLAD